MALSDFRYRSPSCVEHVKGQRENNRAEVSHQPIRQRERLMPRFKSRRHAKRFVSAHGQINNLFRIRRHLLKAHHYRELRDRLFATWDVVSYFQKADRNIAFFLKLIWILLKQLGSTLPSR